jgi:hypothetical protein
MNPLIAGLPGGMEWLILGAVVVFLGLLALGLVLVIITLANKE